MVLLRKYFSRCRITIYLNGVQRIIPKSAEHTLQKYVRCVSEDILIAKFPNPTKKNNEQIKQVCYNKKVNCACYKSENNSDSKIYVYMARMYGDDV